MRITYLFLVALLNRANFKFPFIVDSPVTGLDTTSKEQIAITLVDFIDRQYIGFLLDAEHKFFANVLDERLKNNINLIVAIPKNNLTEYLINQAKQFPKDTELDMWANGIVSYNKDFFYNYIGGTQKYK